MTILGIKILIGIKILRNLVVKSCILERYVFSTQVQIW